MEKEFISHGNVYCIIAEEPDIIATHNGVEVGRFEINLEDDGIKEGAVALGVNVNENHLRRGIAREMVKMAVELHEKFSLPSRFAPGGRKVDSRDYFTSDGLGLFQKCLAEGIISEAFFREETYEEEPYGMD